MVDWPRQWALLYGRNHNRLTPLHGKRSAHDYGLGLAAVGGYKLRTVGAGGHPVLLLHPQLRQTWLAQCSQFGRAWRKIHSPAAAAVTHAVVGRDVGHVGDVGVVDDGSVHVCDVAVVIELVMVPIATVIATPDISIAVVHTAVIADIAAPEAAVPSITISIIAPISWSP
jgi:hypothetical protein